MLANFRQHSILLFFIGCTAWPSLAQDTFSIIAADPQTGEIGAAGATCVDGIAALGGIQLLNKMIPGRGGVNAQASVCIAPHINLDNAVERMNEGFSPQEILDYLYDNDECFASSFNPEARQYGIVDFDNQGQIRTAAFSGEDAFDWKGHVTGPTYAIQGNILLGEEIITNMENGFNNTEGSLAEKLMAAMQGANVAGADVRCLDRGTSSTSAFMRIVRPMDDANAPYLELNVLEMPFGEEPIDSLQTLFDEWQVLNSVDDLNENEHFALVPNPAQTQVQLVLASEQQAQSVSLYSTLGQQVLTQKIDTQSTSLDISILPPGVYWTVISFGDQRQVSKKLVKQ